jgi:Tol biopolymer transport system component/DNA-binding winged helix-turn-helix (wHTH) protein
MDGSVLPDSRHIARFGIFEVDLRTGELRKAGVRIRVQGQPMRILTTLIEKPGELVTREQLQQCLWPGVSSLDFEHGLNMAVKKLRAALNDSPETPRYIETLPRQGYRFIAPVETVKTEPAPTPPIETAAQKTPWRPRALLIGSATVAVLFASIAAVWTRAPAPARIITFFSSPGAIAQLCFSPDGKTMAFALAAEGERPKIFLKAPGIATARRLTDDATDHGERYPAWVPDGTGVSYIRSADGFRPALYFVPATGGAPHKLMEVPQLSGYSWAPDAHSIAISDRTPEGRLAIYSLRLDGHEQQLSHPPISANTNPGPGGDSAPQYAPDGSRIAFVRRLSDGGIAFEIMPAGGGEPAEAARFRQTGSTWSWSADSRALIVPATSETGVLSLYRVQISSRTVTPLAIPASGNTVASVAVAARGSRLAWVFPSRRSEIWRYQLPHGAGSPAAPVRVAAAEGKQISPAFAPDGQRFAFASDRTGAFEIYVSDRDGINPMQLTSFAPGGAGWPRWSPDGSRIAFDARRDGRSGIYVIDAAGGSPRLLRPGAGDDAMPEWSPDGRWIYYTHSPSEGGSDIWKSPSVGGDATRITTHGAFGGLPSPDGGILYLGKRSGDGLYAFPLRGGAETKVTESQPKFSGVAAGGIYWVSGELRGPAVLLHYDFATQRTAPLLTLLHPPTAPALAVSPNGTHILVSHLYDPLSKIMLVENFR